MALLGAASINDLKPELVSESEAAKAWANVRIGRTSEFPAHADGG